MEDNGLIQIRTIQNVIKIFLLVSIIAAIYYFSYLLNPKNIGNVFMYILLVLAEIYIFLQSVGTWYTLLHSSDKHINDRYERVKKRILRDGKAEGGIDVFVTVAGEPIELLEPTLIAARDLKIEHNTYLIDDLGDKFSKENKRYKELAEKLGVKYLKTKNNHQFKVGALNYGLKHSNEKFITNFDADFIPNKNFLIETLPHFWDRKLGWVQSPQSFRNPDNLLSKGSSDAVEAFYEFVMPAKNSFNSALFVGTNAVFRREALDSIGGFQFHHSEDVFTAFCLHKKGWKSIAIPQKLAYGLCPDDTTRLFKQSLRWSGGSLEIFLYGGILKNKMTLDQKFQYFITFSFYLFGVVIFIMLAMPIIYLLTGEKPLQSFNNQWLFHYFPYFIFQFSTIALFASKLSLPAIVVSMNQFPIYIKGLINAIKRKHSKWVVSNLSFGAHSFFATINNLYWHLLVVLISILALIIGAINVRENVTHLISSFWVFTNMILILFFIKGALNADKKAQAE